MGHQNNEKKIGFGPGPFFFNLDPPGRQCGGGASSNPALDFLQGVFGDRVIW